MQNNPTNLTNKVVWNGQAQVIASQLTEASSFFLTFRAPEISAKVKSGQFVYIKTSGLNEPLLRRAFSVMDADKNEGTITLYIDIKGPGTKSLANLKIGEHIDCMGPLGTGFQSTTFADENILIGGGCGMAPLLLLAKEMKKCNKKVHFFYGGRTGSQLVFIDKIKTIADSLTISTDDGSLGNKGVITTLLDSSSKNPIFSCGPKPMLKAIATLFPNSNVALEAEMACGIGVCMGCVVPMVSGGYKRCCSEGPVFVASEVDWS